MTTSISQLSDSTNLGINIGVPLSNNSAFEAEFTTTVNEGNDFFGSGLDLTTMAGYFVYKAGSSTYLKLKGGLLFEDTDIGGFSANDTGLSFGMGVGWKFQSNSVLELEFTLIEADINYISLGYLF